MTIENPGVQESEGSLYYGLRFYLRAGQHLRSTNYDLRRTVYGSIYLAYLTIVQ